MVTPQIDYFSQNYTVYAIDTRGHGKSPRGSAPFTIEQFSKDLKCFFETAHIKSANILGFSDGGNTALTFAANHPELVKKLVICGANLNPLGLKKEFMISLKLEYYLIYINSLITQKSKKKREMLELMLKQPNITPDVLKKIKAPVLVIAGTDDLIYEEHTQFIAKNIPNARLEFIQGDHYIISKKYEIFNDTVNRFLSAP